MRPIKIIIAALVLFTITTIGHETQAVPPANVPTITFSGGGWQRTFPGSVATAQIWGVWHCTDGVQHLMLWQARPYAGQAAQDNPYPWVTLGADVYNPNLQTNSENWFWWTPVPQHITQFEVRLVLSHFLTGIPSVKKTEILDLP